MESWQGFGRLLLHLGVVISERVEKWLPGVGHASIAAAKSGSSPRRFADLMFFLYLNISSLSHLPARYSAAYKTTAANW